MSHLHLPDGVLPPWLWAPGLALALALLARTARSLPPQKIAYQGALGGMMLAAMAVPFGVLEYHLTLSGPLGVLLGPAGGFQACFVVSAILALMGHGGLTTVGLNALVMGSAAVVAPQVYRVLARRLRPDWAMAWSTAAGQTVAGALWLAVVVFALRSTRAGAPTAHGHAGEALMLGLALPLWLFGVVVESVVAFGIGRFLSRVHPALLPAGPVTAAVEGT